MNEEYHTALKKKPVNFNGQEFEKQKESETNDQLFFRLLNKFRQISLLVMYYLIKHDDVTQSWFLVIPQIASNDLCQLIHDTINHSSFNYPFGSGKCGKEGKNIQI